MPKKRKNEDPPKTKIKISKKDKKVKRERSDSEDSDADHDADIITTKHDEGLLQRDDMPKDEILYKLISRIEAQLPKDDVVKYDSR